MVNKTQGASFGDVKLLDSYELKVRDIPVLVKVHQLPDAFTPSYAISISGLSKTSEVLLDEIQEELIKTASLEHLQLEEESSSATSALDKHIQPLLKKYFAYSDEHTLALLKSYLLSRVLGMGYVDILLKDELLEEIAIDNASEPIWVYHRKWGWLRTNIFMSNEEQIKRVASRIGRHVGRQINTLNPLLDAYMKTGERVNATIQPITPRGNTITLRKFSEDPWTITKFIENNTLSAEAAAFLWQVIQFELSILVVGGTASGKTSMLNALANFIPPNQRVLSIEDTRELRLASYLYWVPMLTRVANNEGKGEVSMGDLLVNSLRMRPDRILVGEIRRKREAETLFEAIHTGHSCYGTFHANDAREAIARLTNDPVNVPKALLPAINVMLVQFRNRMSGQRRTFEIAEISEDGTHELVYQYDAKKDTLHSHTRPNRVLKTLMLFTGLTEKELEIDFKQRVDILKHLVKNKMFNVEDVGQVFAQYYKDKESLLNKISKGDL
jgi:flagellar protein FlaI